MTNRYEIIKNKIGNSGKYIVRLFQGLLQKLVTIWNKIATSDLILRIMPLVGTIFPKNYRIKKNASVLDYIIYVFLLWLCVLPLIILVKNNYSSEELFNSHPLITALVILYFILILFIFPLSMFVITPVYRFYKFKGISIRDKVLLKGDSSNWITYKSFYFSLGVISYFLISFAFIFSIWGTYYAHLKYPIVLDLERGLLGYIIFYSYWILFLFFLFSFMGFFVFLLAFPYDAIKRTITKKYIFTSEYPRKILERCNEIYGDDININLSYANQKSTIKDFRDEFLYNQLKHSLIDPLEDLEDILEFIIIDGLQKLPKQNILTWKYFTGNLQISRQEIKNYVLNVVEIVYLYGSKDSSSDGKGDLKTRINTYLQYFFDKLEKDGNFPLKDLLEELESIKKSPEKKWKTELEKGHLNYINIIFESSYAFAERRIAYYVFSMTLILLVFAVINIFL